MDKKYSGITRRLVGNQCKDKERPAQEKTATKTIGNHSSNMDKRTKGKRETEEQPEPH